MNFAKASKNFNIFVEMENFYTLNGLVWFSTKSNLLINLTLFKVKQCCL